RNAFVFSRREQVVAIATMVFVIVVFFRQSLSTCHAEMSLPRRRRKCPSCALGPATIEARPVTWWTPVGSTFQGGNTVLRARRLRFRRAPAAGPTAIPRHRAW